MPRETFFDTIHCTSRIHCKACRLNRSWRESALETFDAPGIDFECPFGETSETVMQLPSLWKQARNLCRSGWRAIIGVITTWRLRTPRRERERRLAICRKRSNECFRESDQRCTECGCFMPVKAALRQESCPRNLWTEC